MARRRRWGSWPRSHRGRGPGGLDPWQWYYLLMPEASGRWGNRGAKFGVFAGTYTRARIRATATKFFGAKIGATAGSFAGPIGQAVGTILGNFVDALKKAVDGAQEFAVTLKETNRRYSYYNAEIAMSYVQSDVISFFRERRIANAIAPSTISLNNSINQFGETVVARDIFRQNMGNEWAQLKLAMSHSKEQHSQSIYQMFNSINEMYNPDSTAGKGLGGYLGETLTLFSLYINPLWSITKAASLIWKSMFPPDVKPPDTRTMLPWDKLVGEPGVFPGRKEVFNFHHVHRRMGGF